MDHRSPLESLFSVISSLPQGHDKPVKHAFYNAVAIFLLFLCCAAGWALCLVLEPFIKPLIWALLVGCVLHPLKHKLAFQFRSWFDSLEESNTPVMIGLILLPSNIINQISEVIGNRIWKYWKVILAFILSILILHGIYFYTPRFLTCVVWKFSYYLKHLISFVIDNFSASAMLLTFIIYMSSMFFLWKPQNNMKFHLASVVMWVLFSCYISHEFGAYHLPVFLILLLIIMCGFVFEIMDVYDELNAAGKTSVLESLKYAFLLKEIQSNSSMPSKESMEEIPTETSPNKPKKTVVIASETTILDDTVKEEITKKTSSLTNTSFLITDQGNIHVLQPAIRPESRREIPKFKRAFSQSHISLPLIKSRSNVFSLRKLNTSRMQEELLQQDEYASDFYIYSLLWACGFMIIWKHSILLPIIPIPILIYVIKHLGIYMGFWSMIHSYWTKINTVIYNWCYDRYDAIIPVPIRGLCRITVKTNGALKNGIRDSFDTVASCVVIFALIIFVVCGSIFIVIQIYAEAIMMVQMTSNVINRTVVHNPELRQLLPPTFDETMDSILDNAYQYGREGISKLVRGIMNDVDASKSEKLEHQILELWDRVYQKWMSDDRVDGIGPKVTNSAVETSWNSFITDLRKSSEVFNVSGIMDFLKQNVGTLMTLLDSIWSIVKGNINILLGSFSAFISILFGGGTAVFNFFFNVIIFFTTLFYLLSASGELYKPVELLTKFSPGGNRLGLALGAAVNSVFTASLKMSAFYGLWTWFIHNVFGVKIVYLPSVIAAIFGAAPFLGTYWACVPAVLDLWLGQEAGVCAILMALCQFVPTYIIDTVIYSEIQGGHPYLTGLAIAGGIFCLGLEGAIVGPLLLCGLYVAMDLSSTLFKDSPSEESLTLPLTSTSTIQSR